MPVRVVSEQSEEQVQKRRAIDALKPVLRALAANMFRVTRGAGNPYDLAPQMDICLKAFLKVYETHGNLPGHEVHAMLDPVLTQQEYYPALKPDMAKRVEEGTYYENGEMEREHGEEEIRRGVLQQIASMLLDQKLQSRRAETEIAQGIRSLAEGHEKSRKYWNKTRTEAALRKYGIEPPKAKKRTRRRKKDDPPIIL